MKGDQLTEVLGHTIQYTDALYNCTPETYIILLTSVAPINSIKKKKKCLKINHPAELLTSQQNHYLLPSLITKTNLTKIRSELLGQVKAP